MGPSNFYSSRPARASSSMGLFCPSATEWPSLSRIPIPLAVLLLGTTVAAGSLGSAEIALASPTPTFTTFTTPTAASDPDQIVAGPDGNVWFTENTGNAIGRVTSAGTITEFPLPTANAQAVGITLGPDGNLWFTESNTDKVGRITPAGVVTEFPLPAGAGPEGIVTGADGNLWVAEFGRGDIGVVSPTGALLTEYPVGLTNQPPVNLVLGSDSRVWFGINNTDDIAAIDTTGAITESVTTQPVFYLAAGADGNVWFSGATSNHTGGTVTPAEVVTETATVGSLFSVTAGPDGDIWGDQAVNGSIVELDHSSNVIATYNYAQAVTNTGLANLVKGPDGNIWFTYGNAGIGVLNLDPAVAPASLPSTGVGPGSWIAGGLGLAALALGIVAVLFAAWRRPRRSRRVS